MAKKIGPVSSLIPQGLLGEIRELIESARERAAATVNNELTLMFWRIGRRIHVEVLAGVRAEYGEQVVVSLAAQLTPRVCTECHPTTPARNSQPG